MHADCRGRWRSDTKQAHTHIQEGSIKKVVNQKGLCKSSEAQGEQTKQSAQAIGIGHSPQLHLHTAAANCITSHTFPSLPSSAPPPPPL